MSTDDARESASGLRLGAGSGPPRLVGLRERVEQFVRAVRDGDEELAAEAVLELSRSRRLVAPLAFVAGGIAMLFEGLPRNGRESLFEHAGRLGLGGVVIVALVLSAFAGESAGSSSPTSPSAQRGSTQTIGGLTLPTSKGKPTPREARQIAKAAYVFGFPLVVMNGTEAQLTNVPSAEQYSAPVNQFNTPNMPFTPSFTAVWRRRWTCCSQTPGSTCPRNRSSSRCPTRTASTTR